MSIYNGKTGLYRVSQESLECKIMKPNKCVVRLKTSFWHDHKGIHIKQDIIFMRRRCAGHNPLEQDAYNDCAEWALDLIINLSSCNDGLYEVKMVNISKDYESGFVDGYRYKLIPFEEDAI